VYQQKHKISEGFRGIRQSGNSVLKQAEFPASKHPSQFTIHSNHPVISVYANKGL
jgi:hypothetical protein